MLAASNKPFQLTLHLHEADALAENLASLLSIASSTLLHLSNTIEAANLAATHRLAASRTAKKIRDFESLVDEQKPRRLQ